MLFQRPPGAGGAFFLDRFETTNADWAEYLSDTGRTSPERLRSRWGGDRPAPEIASLPVARIDLFEARAFARWRLCRVQRWDEWQYARTSGQRFRFPWGVTTQHPWANTADLGLAEPTPVGTFESGRSVRGPYDLIGNVAEWTETVAPDWLPAPDPESEPVVNGRPAVPYDFDLGIDRARGLPALTLWARPLLPCSWIARLPPTWTYDYRAGHERARVRPALGIWIRAGTPFPSAVVSRPIPTYGSRSNVRTRPPYEIQIGISTVRRCFGLRIWDFGGVILPNAWTQPRLTPSVSWTRPILPYDIRTGITETRRLFGLRIWGQGGNLLPSVWLVQTISRQVPRVVAGGSFLRGIEETDVERARLPAEASATVGLRLAASPRDLLLALIELPRALSPWEEGLLERFLDRPGHRHVLREALVSVLAELDRRSAPAGPLRAWLVGEFDL